MAIYGKPNSSEMLVTERKLKLSEGFTRIFEDKERPTPEHVCSPDGIWILPEQDANTVRLLRKKRYTEETDELKEHIRSDEMLGKVAGEIEPKLVEWRERVAKIKSELPLPEPRKVLTHYQAVKPYSNPTT